MKVTGEPCTYNRRPSDKRTRCRQPSTHLVRTGMGGMTATVCADHLDIYLSHGWHLVNAIQQEVVQ